MIGVAIASQKGGVGKTTVALNLSFSLARRGLRTLLADTDPAGAIGLSLTKTVAQAPGLAEYVRRERPLAMTLIRTKLRELSLLPVGGVRVDETSAFSAALEDGRELARLSSELASELDVIVFDTPSGLGGATLGALRASDYVICPVQAEPIAARLALRMFEVVSALREKGARVEIAGVLITMLQTRDRSSLQVAEDLWRTIPSHVTFDTTIPRDAAFLEASAAGVPIGLLRKRPPPVSVVFDQLAAEFEAKTRAPLAAGDDAPLALVD